MDSHPGLLFQMDANWPRRDWFVGALCFPRQDYRKRGHSLVASDTVDNIEWGSLPYFDFLGHCESGQ